MLDLQSVLLLVFTILLILVVKKAITRSSRKATPVQTPLVEQAQKSAPPTQEKPTEDQMTILYSSQSGTAKGFATQLFKQADSHNVKFVLANIKDFEPDTLVDQTCVVFVCSTYTDGTPADDGKVFHDWLEDTSQDHRVPKTFFSGVQYAVFGCGNSQYSKNFNTIARETDEFMHELGGKRLLPTGMGDVDTGEMEQQFEKWSRSFWRSLKKFISKRKKKARGKRREQERANLEKEESASEENDGSGEMLELEDLGRMKRPDEDGGDGEVELHSEGNGPLKDMVGPATRAALTKQGYKLIGGHSGVKLCRWTKSMLRGRGGCYKWTFYGISSFQCMEMTPSLACANKCVFCWRHHTNPVAKEWKWKIDDPEFLVEGAIENHHLLIKSARGIPGVQPEKFKEAQNIRHCALSLVGEPILYPHINRFVDLLHERHISTFMVTNAQFPDQLEALRPVTQLYLSIDAATKDSLKAIDRPLFTDFWERFLTCIDRLKEKGQRTVFRLTLVKQHNMEEVKNYAELIQRGVPDLIEVKGVTFCGDSDTSSLTIKNTPFHQEVVSFCQALCDEANKLVDPALANYALSCEHEHSLCVLIANKNKFLVDGVWHTWIDYDKFHSLVKSGQPFKTTDYMAPSPTWSLYGSEEQGFCPDQERFKRPSKKPPTQGC
jgi:tRNA wybutosine-synthesizing protein 1